MDIENLIDAFETMGASDPSVFASDSVNDKFIGLINNLKLGLVQQNSADELCSDYAAQAAYRAYPFSHMQYQYIHTIVEQQIINIILVEMMYNEYLYQQGLYIDEHYPDEDVTDTTSHHYQYDGFQRTFYNVMNDDTKGINKSIFSYLQHKMNVDVANTIRIDTDTFAYDEAGNKTAYLYFVDDPDATSRSVGKGFPVSFKAVYDG